MFRKSLVLLAVTGMLATFGLLASAYFTSTATLANNTFTVGTLNLTANPTSAALTASALAPGDKITAPITLTNAGSLDLYYVMTSNSTDPDTKALAQQMQLNIKSGVTTCSAAGFDADGTSVYSGQLSNAAFGNPDFATAGWPNMSPGYDVPGDRFLASAANEVLCFQASLPTSAGNQYQNATTTTTFTFSAVHAAR